MIMIFLVGLVTLMQSLNAFPSNDAEVLYPTNSLLNPGSLFPLGGSLPTPRVHHSIANAMDYIIVYGGYSENGSFLGDVNLFYMVNQQWSGPILRYECCNLDNERIETSGYEKNNDRLSSEDKLPTIRTGLQGDIPLSRAEHSTVSIGSKVYLFGGLTQEYSYMNDFYSFDVLTLSWSQINVEYDNVPSPRAGHAMCTDGVDTIYVFGGRSYRNRKSRNTFADSAKDNIYKPQIISSEDTIGLNDVWSFCITTNKWTRLASTEATRTANIPTQRQYASISYHDDKIYMFGGIDPLSNVTFNDVWVFHTKTRVWRQVFNPRGSVRGFAPPPLYHAHMLPLPHDTVNDDGVSLEGFLIYGGIANGGACSGHNCNPLQTVMGQVYQFTFAQTEWGVPVSITGATTDAEKRYASSTEGTWNYARLSTTQNNSLNRGSNTGKLLKNFAMEKIVYVSERKLFYEFGGLRYMTDVEATTERLDTVSTAQATGEHSDTEFLSSGGDLSGSLWDTATGEQLRDRVDTPTNNPAWDYSDAFRLGGKSRNIKFLRAFRVYTVASEDIVLVKEDLL